MSMGGLNAAPVFAAMIMKLQMEWDILATERGLKISASKIIVDDVSMYGRTAEQILDCFRTVMDVLKNHIITLKLKR